ncbi:unknown [Clostridium sp. CAG:448]|nr:unknown [Clostridium sp. CAG:448]
MRCKGHIRVVAGRSRLGEHHVTEIVFLDVRPDLLCNFLFDFSCQCPVQLVRVSCLLQNLLAVNPQYLCHAVRNLRGIVLPVCLTVTRNGGRRDKDTIGRNVGGNHNAVRVINATSVRLYRGFRGHLPDHQLFVLFVVHRLQKQNPRCKIHEKEDKHRGCDTRPFKQSLFRSGPVHASFLLFVPFLLFSYRFYFFPVFPTKSGAATSRSPTMRGDLRPSPLTRAVRSFVHILSYVQSHPDIPFCSSPRVRKGRRTFISYQWHSESHSDQNRICPLPDMQRFFPPPAPPHIPKKYTRR